VGNSRGARKLTRTSHVNQKKKGLASHLIVYKKIKTSLNISFLKI
jgi:hypothetical protein